MNAMIDQQLVAQAAYAADHSRGGFERADVTVDAFGRKGERGKGGGNTRRRQFLVQLVNAEIDRHHGIGPRRDLALHHVTVQIDEAWHQQTAAAVKRWLLDGFRADFGNHAVFDAHRASLDDFIGKNEREIAEPHRLSPETASIIEGGAETFECFRPARPGKLDS